MGFFSSPDLQVITYHCNCSSTIHSAIKWATTFSIQMIKKTRSIGFKNTVFTGSFFQARQTRGPSNRTGEPEDHKHNSENKILNREITENRVNKGSKLELKVALQGCLPIFCQNCLTRPVHSQKKLHYNTTGNESLLNIGKNFQN